jgi:hypothetical protein
MNRLLRFALWLILGSAQLMVAQPTILNGVLPLSATPVTALDAGTGAVTVANLAPFNIGDQVLLIQMQGAIINTNNIGFGDLIALNGAGSYEVNVVCDVRTASNEVLMENTLLGTYSSSAATAGIQLIRIPQHEDVVVSGPLTAPAWNGSTGGVLIFSASGTVTLNADIDMSGQGFRGGDYLDMNVDDGSPICLNTLAFLNTRFTDFYYSLADQDGASKGEGIAAYTTGREYGRGRQANGGGGGNEHDSGGGGGGNYGAGGIGSERMGGSCNGEHPGVGGSPLDGDGYQNGSQGLFMGGGGGAGHSNNDEDPDYPGGNGGGLVIILANQLVGNGNRIMSNGQGYNFTGTLFSDGGSGGGAGGAVILSASGLTGSLIVEARGGKGTEVNGSSTSNCPGPGGGGAGGVIWTNIPLAGMTTNVSGGAAGFDNNAACPSSTSAPGGSGATFTDYVLPMSATSTGGCVLPVVLQAFEGELRDEVVALRWTSTTEINHQAYRVERLDPDQRWKLLGELPGQGNTSQPTDYTFQDWLPRPGANHYRLVMLSLDGELRHSKEIEVRYQPGQRLRLLSAHQASDRLQGRVHLPTTQPWQLTLYDLSGKVLYREAFAAAQAGPQSFAIGVPSLASGVYVLTLQQAGQRAVQRVMIGDQP